MPKKIAEYALLFLVCFMLSACDRTPRLGPEEVLNNYLDAALKGRYEEAYAYISAADQAIKDLQTYLKENEDMKPLLSEAYIAKVSFKMLRVEKADTKALADVEISRPYVGLGRWRETAESLAQKFKSGKVELETKQETFQIVKDKGGWKVFLDWETEKKNREKFEQVMSLVNEARAAEKAQNYQEALEKYEQVLKLDNVNLDAVVGIQEIKNKIQASAAKK